MLHERNQVSWAVASDFDGTLGAVGIVTTKNRRTIMT